MSTPLELRSLIRERARRRCEYCRLPEGLTQTPFQSDHIIAEVHDGPTAAENLAFACYYCNTYKGPNLAGMDAESGQVTRLFHPRLDDWQEHFRWAGGELAALTPIGRATIRVLRINHPDFSAMREALMQAGLFPTD